MAYPQTPPDLQVIQTLAYLWRKLRSDPVLGEFTSSPNQIVSSTLMRPAVRGLEAHQIHSAGVPYLAVWRARTERHPNYRINHGGNVGKAGIQWFTQIPSGGKAPTEGLYYDGLTWGANLAHLVWARIQFYLEDRDPDNAPALIRDAYLEQIDGDVYEILTIEGVSLIGFEGLLNFEHTHPMYAVPEGIDLQKVGMTIQLYDGTPSDLGIGVGAEVDV